MYIRQAIPRCLGKVVYTHRCLPPGLDGHKDCWDLAEYLGRIYLRSWTIIAAEGGLLQSRVLF